MPDDAAVSCPFSSPVEELLLFIFMPSSQGTGATLFQIFALQLQKADQPF